MNREEKAIIQLQNMLINPEIPISDVYEKCFEAPESMRNYIICRLEEERNKLLKK